MKEWLEALDIRDFPLKYQEFILVAAKMIDEKQAIALTVQLSKHYPKQGFYFSDLRGIVAAKKKNISSSILTAIITRTSSGPLSFPSPMSMRFSQRKGVEALELR